MRRVLLDACVPHWLRHELADLEVQTAWFAGLAELPDSELLKAIEGHFDVLVTLDRNMSYQQRVVGRSIAVVVLRPANQTPSAFKSLLPELRAALQAVRQGTAMVVG